MSFLQDIPQLAATSAQKRLTDDADTFTGHMDDLLTEMRAAATLAQAKQAHYAPSAPAPTYQPGQLVWLDTRNVRTKHPCKKLDYKSEGPFEVIKAVGRRSYKLKLPASMKIFDTFHTSLLRAAANDPLPGQRAPSPPPVIIEREGKSSLEYELDAVEDSRRIRKKLHYTVRWSNGEITDEPWSNVLPGSEVAVALFHKNNPLKPGPPASFKDKLELRVMDSVDELPHAMTAIEAAASVMKVRSYAAHAELAMHVLAVADRSRGPVNAVVRASADVEQELLMPIIVAEGDLWLLDVAGAPYWEGESNVTK
jgi:hypothetical protein